MEERDKAAEGKGSIDDIREFFSHDRFATEAARIKIVEAEEGRSVCEMPIEGIHENALGNVMGGAIFTLGDFALSVCINLGPIPSVSIESSIRFLSPAKGSRLIATAVADRMGRQLSFVTIRIDDDLGTSVAIMTATGYRRP